MSRLRALTKVEIALHFGGTEGVIDVDLRGTLAPKAWFGLEGGIDQVGQCLKQMGVRQNCSRQAARVRVSLREAW